MRMFASHYSGKAEPALGKKTRAELLHVMPPLDGLSLALPNAGDPKQGYPQTATILVNFVVEDDSIKCRAGYKKIATHGTAPVWHLIPWYGGNNALAAASNHELWNAQNGTLLKGGFTSDDWHWTAFSNLAQADFTVMVNGADGVWSWDGTLAGAGFVKETVTNPTAEPWIVPDQFNIVIAHMNRLFFADGQNLAVYYLPLQQKSGEVKVLPLNAVFRRGGHIRAMYTWTIDGGAGINDQLVIFSSNGECVIYAGTDPDTDFALTGIFRFDSPMSKHSVANYGGDLLVLVSTGLLPMSTLLAAEGEQLGRYATDKGMTSLFLKNAITYRADLGWQTFLNPSTGRMFCNIPQGAPNRYKQFIRHMPKDVWTTFEDVPARCWGWIDPYVYFGDDSGNIYQMHPQYFNDDGKPIRVDVQMAWNKFKTSVRKRFLAIQTYLTSDGTPSPIIDIKVDYDYSPGVNTPDISEIAAGAIWNDATWDVDAWAPGDQAFTIWNGVAGNGHSGAVRLTTLIQTGTFAVNGFDVLFEAGQLGP